MTRRRRRVAPAGTPWWERRTLRFRVLASILAVMVGAFAVIALVTVLSLNRFLLGRLDQQVNAASARYVGAAEESGRSLATNDGDDDTDDGFGDARGQAEGTLGARITGAQVSRIGIVGRRHPPSAPADVRQTLVALPIGHYVSRDLGLFGDYRLRAATLRDGDRVVVGLPLRPLHETLAELLVVELAVFGGVLLITVAIGGWLIGLSLRPLTRVTATARRVSESSLAEDDPELTHRVQTPVPGTEVGQLGVAFNHMLDHVESSLLTRRDTEQRLRQFIADASHELRTPVAAIRGHAESVRRLREPLPEPVLSAMARIESEAVRMGVLVDDLLLLARLDAGRPLERAEVDLSRLSIEAMDDAHAASRDHHWLLDLPDEPIIVIGDDHRLRELVTNMLTNARTHTPPGTTVQLTATRDDLGRFAVLRVSDDGPGIPASAQSRVFERFYRADPGRAPMTGGSGLGLAIVAAVAQAHGGDVTMSSEPGNTTFVVRLPLVD